MKQSSVANAKRAALADITGSQKVTTRLSRESEGARLKLLMLVTRQDTVEVMVFTHSLNWSW